MWGDSPEAHGGYLVRLETFAGLDLGRLAREALALDLGATAPGTALCISVSRRRKVIRLAYVGAHEGGRGGARWYGSHHGLARLLSDEAHVTVHAYLFDPDEGEEVIAYGNGRRVGGERLRYEDVELPCEPEALDDAAFARLRSRWPLGHLAYICNLTREELLALPRSSSSALVDLDALGVGEGLDALLPSTLAPPRSAA
ncbi:hypothetical protein P2318_11255 [Myxococcaceae bacterium GXIMD 01537]